MTPEEFIEKWKISRYELCGLLGKSIDTVNHWFSQSDRQPTQDVYLLLTLIDHEWSVRKDSERRLPAHLWALYESVRERIEE